MLQPFLDKLNAERIILASGSPRRKQILENIGLKIEIVPSEFEENLDKSAFPHPQDYVTRSALLKALDTAKTVMSSKTDSGKRLPFLIIGADTVVTRDDKIIEKPHNRQHAFDMLSSLADRNHSVYTGVALLLPNREFTDEHLPVDSKYELVQFHAQTEVEFDEITPEMIWAYVDTGEPMDKAGGYGIQGIGGTLVKGIHGDYFNVMGFPLNLFAKHLVDICSRKLT